jgi:large subunit ribosomal protein L29
LRPINCRYAPSLSPGLIANTIAMKTKELRNLSQEELKVKQRSLKEELFKLNQERYGTRVEKPHRFGLVRRDIARVETLLNEKKEKKNG